MSLKHTELVRQLVPKSFHFDGYNELNCPNTKKQPFFANGQFQLGNYTLNIHFSDENTITLDYSGPCKYGKILFLPYRLSINEYVEKLKNAVKIGSDFISFDIVFRNFEFIYMCRDCPYKNKDCQHLIKTNPVKVLAAVSFNINEVKEALSAMYFETNTTTKGGNTMNMKKNGIFGLNIELGISKDPNIASTLMGVAVKNPESGNWYVFDAARNTRKNLSNIKMGNFPIFLLPVKALEVGSLTKIDGKYYYVKAVNSNNTITLLGAADGVIREMIPEENIIPGLTIYTKVVAFDTNSLMDTSSKENMGGNVLAAICMMQWANGNTAEFSLDNINDNSFNGLGACLPFLMATNNGSLGGMFANSDGSLNLPMLMAFGSGTGNGDGNDMMQYWLLSQLMGGNNTPSLFNPTPQTPTTEVTVACEKCGATYTEEINFCPKCGGKIKKMATTCRKCGAELKKDALFCHVCGTKVAPDSCPNCGRTIEATENFCSGCGTSLKAPVSVAAPVPPAAIPVAPASEPASETPAKPEA